MLRDRALRLLAESDEPSDSLASLYDATPDESLRMRLISILADRRDARAVAKLRDIAKNDPSDALQRRALRRLSDGAR